MDEHQKIQYCKGGISDSILSVITIRPKDARMLRFIVYHNEELIKTYEIEDCPVTIGRLPENNVSIANMGISRRHVRIERDTNRNFLLSDLNSLNGTFVNTNKVKKTVLKTGDQIMIGKYTILFQDLAPYETPAKKPEPAAVSPKATAEPPPAAAVAPKSKPVAKPPKEAPAALPSEDDLLAGHAGHGSVLIETNKHVVYKLEKALMTIGSSEDDDIFASGFMIGESQIFLEKKEDGYWINTRKMMGRIKVNGKKINSHRLAHKDRIEIGNSTFRFMENG
jgi:pSer/pThr/pTyr-binding forkhead associated (FHA) protein